METLKKQKYLLIAFLSIFLFSCDNKEEEIIDPKEPVFLIEPDSVNILVNSSYQLVVKLDGEIVDNNQIEWYSNSNAVSVSDDGLITGLIAGNEIIDLVTYITAKHKTKSYVAKAKVTVSDVYKYKYRIILKDKGVSDYSVNDPEKFLSQRAIERRLKRNIPIDESDLPISSDYIQKIEKVGGTIVARSKWLNSVCVSLDDVKLVEEYKKLPFVGDVIMVWREGRQGIKNNKYNEEHSSSAVKAISNSNIYGVAHRNIVQHQGEILHQKGFKGEGIEIAVIDGGFIGVESNPSLSNVKIKGAKSFIYEKNNPYTYSEHGSWVLSCMGTNMPEMYTGSAPEAAYWLFVTEDTDTESPVEEDYLVNCMEYADSTGVDLINLSLGYYYYDFPFSSPKFEDMDGKTMFATRGANKSFEKGMLIVCSAGNHGYWVGTPADSPDVLAVGGIDTNGKIGAFTAYGITVDGRMKPDVLSLSMSSAVINSDGKTGFKSGTSFASPIFCGLTACLWQAYPQLTNRQLLEILRQSADRSKNPQLPYGWGIPDMEKAMKLAEKIVN